MIRILAILCFYTVYRLDARHRKARLCFVRDFVHTLIEETQSFAGQVVLVHGDSHYFKIDKAMYNDDGTLTGNFTRVEVFGSGDNSWIEMTVDPSTENVFTFTPVVLN